MATTATPHSSETWADALDRLGNVSLERIRFQPCPATVDDVIQIERRENRLFELVDGVLVEKVMGHLESRVAAALIKALEEFAEQSDLGAVTGEGGMFRFPRNLVRIPDVAFARWESFPDEASQSAAVPEIAPDLAVEILSQGNTPREMARKLKEYFAAGVKLVWFVDLKQQAVTVYTSPMRSKVLPSSGVLEGGAVLPGFQLKVSRLFARLKPRGGNRPKK